MDINKFSNLIDRTEEELMVLKGLNFSESQKLYEDLMPIFKEFKEGGQKLLKEGSVLQIGIVGQVKAGKSSFLNSLFFNGDNILPKASTPMTAGLTVLEYSDENSFEIEYFSNDDWEVFTNQNEAYKRAEAEIRRSEPNAPQNIINRMIEERTTDEQRSAHEMVVKCSSAAKAKIGSRIETQPFDNIKELQNILEQYVGAKGEYTSVVKSLYIKLNDSRLKGMRIVDTPGVNDPVVSRENRTRLFLHSCHGVFLLSSSTDFLGSGDIKFLNNRISGQGISSVLLLASKFDSVLQDLGAECEMKGMRQADLAEVQDNQLRKLKKRLREQQDTINDNIKIKLDFTAGIGFSIAHKPKEKWDAIEQNVVKQMQRYYPDYFESDEDTQNTFEALSNIKEIRESYLNGWFMTNKETIIAQKVNDYFEKNKADIICKLEKKVEALETKHKQVKEASVDQIKKQTETQGKIFDNLDSTFKHIFSTFSTTLQSALRNIKNNITTPTLREIPTETTEGTVEYKGMLWGHNSDKFDYTIVNSNLLYYTLKDKINEYADILNNKWKELFDNARKELSTKLYDQIADFEKTIDSDYTFDDKYYRNLIDQTLDSLRLQQVLPLKSIKDEAEQESHAICDKQFYPGDCAIEVKSSLVPEVLGRASAEFIMGVRNAANNHITAYIKEIDDTLQDNMIKAITEIEKMKSEFGPRLKEEGQNYLHDLEIKLKDKEKSVKEIESVLESAKKIYSIYK